MARYIVTVTPPTPNGDLHLGHLSGPFMAADVMRRGLEAQGHEVLMVCYSDDYQSYMPRKAEAIGRDPQDYAALMHRAITLSADLAGCAFDAFPSSGDNPWFAESVNHYLDCVSDDLTRETVKVHYSEADGKWGHEAFARGDCNHCGASTDASQCENCAGKPDPLQMTNVTSITTGLPTVLREQEATVWHLGHHFPELAKRHAARPMRDDLLHFLAENLSNTADTWPITRPGDAGLPVARFGGEPVHTWFMGLAGYRAAVKAHLEDAPQKGRFADWWSPSTELIHFLGFDCSYSHAVAYGVQQICDPDGPQLGTFLTNRFLKLDGDDFSTSRGNAIWIKDVTGQYPLDAIRLFTALNAPEEQVENFSLAEFKDWVTEVYTPMNAAIRSGAGTPSATWESHPAALAARAAQSPEAFSMQRQARAIMALFEAIQAAPAAKQPSGYATLAALAAPIMPGLTALKTESKTHELV
ncbi:class I tRNA ligase family protein [Pacificoceanicola onchidii]|uniref:class I tRNA ligase family protein n=1 Tax=Pacificoceanicola onchidii TaxID=2562685 RepID=UPI0014560409|nr:class I tRNA ligase family protein [Pacificoceanicola onchidii]